MKSQDIYLAFSMLSRIPVPRELANAHERAAMATWAYPVVGGTVGLLAGLVGALLLTFGVGPEVAMALTLGFMMLLTGALHEDGLADTLDGLGGGNSQAQRLKIMKDSRIGTYGCVAVTLALLIRWAGLVEISSGSLILWLAAIGASSRLPMVLALYAMEPARPGGLAATVGKPPDSALVVASGLCLIFCLGIFGWIGIVILGVSLLGALPVFMLAAQRIGGHTGDILGASQQCAEISAIIAVTTLIH